VLQPANLVPRLASDVRRQIALGDLLGQDAEVGERIGDQPGKRQRQRDAQGDGDAEQHQDGAAGVVHDPLGAGEVAVPELTHLPQAVEGAPAQERREGQHQAKAGQDLPSNGPVLDDL